MKRTPTAFQDSRQDPRKELRKEPLQRGFSNWKESGNFGWNQAESIRCEHRKFFCRCTEVERHPSTADECEKMRFIVDLLLFHLLNAPEDGLAYMKTNLQKIIRLKIVLDQPKPV